MLKLTMTNPNQDQDETGNGTPPEKTPSVAF